MLFMSIYTVEPENRDAVLKRGIEKGTMIPPGMEVLGDWGSLAGERSFRLVETDDPKAFVTGAMAWTDLGKLEVYPVLPLEELVKLIPDKK